MISERQLKTKDRRKNKETKKKNITLKTNAAAPQFRLQCMRSSKWQRRLSCDAGIACEEEEDESVAEHNSRTARRQYIQEFRTPELPTSYLPPYLLTTYWGGHKQRYDFWPSLVLGTSAAWSDVWLSHFFQDNPMCLLSTHFGNSCEPKVRGNVP